MGENNEQGAHHTRIKKSHMICIVPYKNHQKIITYFTRVQKSHEIIGFVLDLIRFTRISSHAKRASKFIGFIRHPIGAPKNHMNIGAQYARTKNHRISMAHPTIHKNIIAPYAHNRKSHEYYCTLCAHPKITWILAAPNTKSPESRYLIIRTGYRHSRITDGLSNNCTDKNSLRNKDY